MNNRNNTLFKILALCTLLPISLYLSVWLYLSFLAKSGQSGTEYFALFTLLPLSFFIVAMVAIDTVVALVYLVTNRPRGKNLVIPFLTLLLPLLLIGLYIDAAKENEVANRRMKDGVSISKEEALRRINNCEVSSIEPESEYINPSLHPTTGSPFYDSTEIKPADYESAKQAFFESKERCKVTRPTR